MTNKSPIAILGAGSWGTALAIQAARNQQAVRLWGRDSKALQAIASHRENRPYLPGIRIPEAITVESHLPSAIAKVRDLLLAVPSQALLPLLTKYQPYITKEHRLAWATKGIDPVQHRCFHHALAELFGEDRPMAFLAGPSFAKEVALAEPTAVTFASNQARFAHDLVTRFHTHYFRVYTSTDIVGAQIASTVKNVLAIAVGIAAGLGFGANTKAALMTRGLAEMTRLGLAMGAQQATFMGLAGMGDLVLTCSDNQSRNRRFGVALAQGANPAQAALAIQQVVEGIHNAEQVMVLARRYRVTMPICEHIHKIVLGKTTPREVVETLLTRDLRESEFE